MLDAGQPHGRKLDAGQDTDGHSDAAASGTYGALRLGATKCRSTCFANNSAAEGTQCRPGHNPRSVGCERG